LAVPAFSWNYVNFLIQKLRPAKKAERKTTDYRREERRIQFPDGTTVEERIVHLNLDFAS
jgi:hypothetical protein